MPGITPDWYQQWLNENNAPVYYNWASQGMRTPGMGNWFSNNYGTLYNKYQGVQGQGGDPFAIPSFANWLKSINPTTYYQNNVPSAQRGWSSAKFAPTLRWLMY